MDRYFRRWARPSRGLPKEGFHLMRPLLVVLLIPSFLSIKSPQVGLGPQASVPAVVGNFQEHGRGCTRQSERIHVYRNSSVFAKFGVAGSGGGLGALESAPSQRATLVGPILANLHTRIPTLRNDIGLECSLSDPCPETASRNDFGHARLFSPRCFANSSSRARLGDPTTFRRARSPRRSLLSDVSGGYFHEGCRMRGTSLAGPR